MGRKTHKQNFATLKIPGQSHENVVYVFFSLFVFFAPVHVSREGAKSGKGVLERMQLFR